MSPLPTAPGGATHARRTALCGLCCVRAAALCGLAVLAACGGADDAGVPTVPTVSAVQAPAELPADPVAIVAGPLLSDDGSLMPSDPAAVPTDPGARTRAGRYATAAQARQLAHAFQARLVPVMVACCSPVAVDEAVLTAWGVQAAANMPPDAPFLVQGPDARLNAAAAERLAEGGAARVWVVAP